MAENSAAPIGPIPLPEPPSALTADDREQDRAQLRPSDHLTDAAKTDLLSRDELVRYFRTEEYADEIADIISNFPPAEHITGVAQRVPEPVASVVPCYVPSGKRVALYSKYQDLPIGTELYAAQPPAAPVETEPFTDDQVHYAARKLALCAPGMYEDANNTGSLQPNTAALTTARMMLDAAVRNGENLNGYNDYHDHHPHQSCSADTESEMDRMLGELLAGVCSHEAINEAMQDAWNDICTDTGCHPLDIEHGKGKHLTFSPNHWANQVAKRLFVRALKLRLEMPAQPQEAPEHINVDDSFSKYSALVKANRVLSLANKIDLHLTLSGSSPGFHLSEDELQMAAAALRFAAVSSLSRPKLGGDK